MPFGPIRTGPGGGGSSSGGGSDDSDSESENDSGGSSGSSRSRTPSSGGHIPGAPSEPSPDPEPEPSEPSSGDSDPGSVPTDQLGGMPVEAGAERQIDPSPEHRTGRPVPTDQLGGSAVDAPSGSDPRPDGELSEWEEQNIRQRTPRASQSQSLGTTGTPGLAAGPRSQAAREQQRAREGVADSDRNLYDAELRARAEAQVEAETGREADVTISTRREGNRLVADVVDIDLGEPVEGELVEDPTAGPIATGLRRATGDPLGGFRASVYDRRGAIEETRVEAVEDLEAGVGIDFDGVLPGTPASRKAKIDSFVGERAETAATAATILPRAGLALAGRGVETVEDEVGVDLSQQAVEEAEKLGVGATIVPRAAASAGAEFARDGGANTKETLATAATVGVLAPEPASTATGLAVLGGLGVAAGAGYLSESELGVGDPTESTTELGVGGQTQDVDELGVGEQPQDVAEVEVGGESRKVTEIDIPVEETSDPATLHTSELVGLQKQRHQKPTIGKDEIITDLPDPDQAPPSVRERMRRDDLLTPNREFPTGESAVVGRGTAQGAAEDIAQEDAMAEDTVPTEDEVLDSGEALAPAVDEEADTGLDTDLPPGQATEQVPDVAQESLTQPALEAPAFGTPTGFGNPTRVRDPTLPGGSPTPSGRRPRPVLPDIDLGADKKKRRPVKGSNFEKDFSSPVATPEDVLNSEIAATDSTLPEEEPL